MTNFILVNFLNVLFRLLALISKLSYESGCVSQIFMKVIAVKFLDSGKT